MDIHIFDLWMSYIFIVVELYVLSLLARSHLKNSCPPLIMPKDFVAVHLETVLRAGWELDSLLACQIFK
jgi:hypothetical protein